MKLNIYAFALAFASLFVASCHDTQKVEEPPIPVFNEPDPPVWTMSSKEVELGTPDFDTFDIERDYTKLNEKLYTDPSKKMYVENTKFEDEIKIVFEGNKALVDCDNTTDFSIQTNGAHVTISTKKNVACSLTGKTDNGSLKILGDNEVRINLNGVNLKNASGPAINNQSQQQCFLVTDSISVLSDDSLYAETTDSLMLKGCIYSCGKMAISGEAPLKIIAKGADALHSSKSIFVRRCTNIDIESNAGNAIKAKNNIKIEGGMLNINSTGRGGNAITASKIVEINGGRTTVISNTGYGKEGKNARAIKSDSLISITGGIIRVKESSVGGKAIRAGHTFQAKNCIIDVLTFGNDDMAAGSKNRGIQGAQEINIDSSRVRVRCYNGKNEALSSHRNIIIKNSLLELRTDDDAISAGDIKVADIDITNSHIYANAGMDGLDSNGTIHIHSGVLFSIGRKHAGRGFDCDAHEFLVGPETVLIGLGQMTSPITARLLEHPACHATRALSDKMFCISTAGSNDNLVSFEYPELGFRNTGYSVLCSVPGFKDNETYDFCNNATVKPEHTFHGLLIGGQMTEKSVTDQYTLRQTYASFCPEGVEAFSYKPRKANDTTKK